MDFVDNVIEQRDRHDPRPRACSPIPTALFTPGMFARVQVPGSPPYQALLVPTPPSAPSRRANSCWSSTATNVAQQKYVTLGALVDGLRVIKDGLERRRPRHRQRPDARAAGQQGDAAGAGRTPRAPRRPHSEERTEQVGALMRISHFFIDRPIFAARGLDRVRDPGRGRRSSRLPIAQYPEIAPPIINVTGQYPGASAEVVASTVVAPIEEQINGVENMLYMSSNSTADGRFSIAVTFDLGTNLDIAQVQVQNRVAIAQPRLPADVRNIGVTVDQELARPDDGRAPLFARQVARHAVHLQLRRRSRSRTR